MTKNGRLVAGRRLGRAQGASLRLANAVKARREPTHEATEPSCRVEGGTTGAKHPALLSYREVEAGFLTGSG
jgi:hypothetical protein